jgi:superoxide reductase
MTKLNEVYRCEVCGNVVEVVNPSTGQLVCCGKPMNLEQEHNEDKGLEKHVPVINKKGNYITVKVGDIEHPMEETHYIEWIELIVDGAIHRTYLTYMDKPEVSFTVPERHIEISARAYCNIHGLWKS